MEQDRIAVVIEDDADIRSLLRDVLEQAGFSVFTASTGLEGVELVREHDPIVATLDVSMPGMDGFETARRIRAFSNAYLVMLSARTDEIDTLQGLEAGADDYVTKPFGVAELAARVRVALRHRLQQQGERPIFQVGDLSVDLVKRIVKLGGRDVALSPKEYDILRLLVIHAGKVLTHRMLMQEVWGAGGDVQYLRIYIRQLRQKLEPDPERPTHIVTETGVGYRLKLPE